MPEEYAKKFDAKNPSTYNTHVVATGPYMIKNDASGNLIGYKPGKSIDLVRNPNWDKSTDFKPAYLDSITWTTNEADASIAAQQVLTGSHLALEANPPAAQLKDAVQNRKGQFQQVPAGGFRYFPLNTTIKPLDNINVRKAIIAAFDRDAAPEGARRQVHGRHPDALPPARHPGLRGGRRRGRAPGSTS